MPAFDLFPFETWARLQARFWRKPSAARLGYGDPAGDATLRELVAAYLRSSRGLNCDPAQIVITCGAQQAISLCAQLLVQPGDRVLLIDDLIATGGTMMAGKKLLEKLGAQVSEGAAIVDLPQLQGSARLRESGLTLFTLVDFDGH